MSIRDLNIKDRVLAVLRASRLQYTDGYGFCRFAQGKISRDKLNKSDNGTIVAAIVALQEVRLQVNRDIDASITQLKRLGKEFDDATSLPKASSTEDRSRPAGRPDENAGAPKGGDREK